MDQDLPLSRQFLLFAGEKVSFADLLTLERQQVDPPRCFPFTFIEPSECSEGLAVGVMERGELLPYDGKYAETVEKQQVVVRLEECL